MKYYIPLLVAVLLIGMTQLFVMILLIHSDSLPLPNKVVSPFAASSSFVPSSFQLARSQSNGFFNETDEVVWKRLQDRVTKTQFPNHLPEVTYQYFINQKAKDIWHPHSNRWYQDNFEPNFSCQGEARIGGFGDGAKWVCDPHRIAAKVEASKHIMKSSSSPCLVYSIGSFGNSMFEEGVKRQISPDCEIHTFDVMASRNGIDYAKVVEPYSTFHNWGLGSVEQVRNEPNKYKTLRQTLEELGHMNRTIDIFKIDCEGCEYDVYQEWLDLFPKTDNSGVEMKQILVEVHGIHANKSIPFFYDHHNHGYVIFHKEPNIIAGGGMVEYGFLKLNPEFMGNSLYYSHKQ